MSKKTKYPVCDLSPEAFYVREDVELYSAGANEKMSLFSFFSGAGFLDLGFEWTKKYAIRFVNEIQHSFLQTYRYSRNILRLPEPSFGYSVADINWFLDEDKFNRIFTLVEKAKKVGAPVGFIGGPPCPDFSVGGKNRGQHGENGKLSGTCFLISYPEGVPPSITPGASRGTGASQSKKPRRGVTTSARCFARFVTPLTGLCHYLRHHPPACAGGYRWLRPFQGACPINYTLRNKINLLRRGRFPALTTQIFQPFNLEACA